MFVISKVGLVPNDTVALPLGDILLVGFDGAAGYAWIKHNPNEQAMMNVATLPTGGPFELQTDEGFAEPVHAGSFFKTLENKIKLPGGQSGSHTSAWHVFCWRPKLIDVRNG